MAIAARSGVRSASIEQIHAAYSMGATRMQVIWHVIMKSALPEIFTGMRIGIGVGWTTLVAGEMVASTRASAHGAQRRRVSGPATWSSMGIIVTRACSLLPSTC